VVVLIQTTDDSLQALAIQLVRIGLFVCALRMNLFGEFGEDEIKEIQMQGDVLISLRRLLLIRTFSFSNSLRTTCFRIKNCLVGCLCFVELICDELIRSGEAKEVAFWERKPYLAGNLNWLTHVDV